MTTYHHHSNVRGQKLFYWEAGSGNSPTTATRMLILWGKNDPFFTVVREA
jgi:hypothetical protein